MVANAAGMEAQLVRVGLLALGMVEVRSTATRFHLCVRLCFDHSSHVLCGRCLRVLHAIGGSPNEIHVRITEGRGRGPEGAEGEPTVPPAVSAPFH